MTKRCNKNSFLFILSGVFHFLLWFSFTRAKNSTRIQQVLKVGTFEWKFSNKCISVASIVYPHFQIRLQTRHSIDGACVCVWVCVSVFLYFETFFYRITPIDTHNRDRNGACVCVHACVGASRKGEVLLKGRVLWFITFHRNGEIEKNEKIE